MSRVASLLGTSGGSFLFPPASSTTAGDVDGPFYFILYLSCFFFFLIIALMTFFVIRYRRRSSGPRADQKITHHTGLEVAWSVIPLLLLIVIFALGYKGYLNMSVAPKDPIEIKVTAQKWSWSFEYMGSGATSSKEFAVPVGRPVKLILHSRDVIHSFYVPSFRIKMDALPGRYTTVWFEATPDSLGKTQQVYCTEYCGLDHSNMLATIVVLSQEDYDKWVAKHAQVGNTPEERGAKTFAAYCASCHAVGPVEKQPTPTIGPRLYQKFGAKENLADGSTVIVDETYIRRSIEYPNAQLVATFNPQMPSFKGTLSEEKISDIIAYIKSLK